jgi:hypothetical protein
MRPGKLSLDRIVDAIEAVSTCPSLDLWTDAELARQAEHNLKRRGVVLVGHPSLVDHALQTEVGRLRSRIEDDYDYQSWLIAKSRPGRPTQHSALRDLILWGHFLYVECRLKQRESQARRITAEIFNLTLSTRFMHRRQAYSTDQVRRAEERTNQRILVMVCGSKDPDLSAGLENLVVKLAGLVVRILSHFAARAIGDLSDPFPKEDALTLAAVAEALEFGMRKFGPEIRPLLAPTSSRANPAPNLAFPARPGL